MISALMAGSGPGTQGPDARGHWSTAQCVVERIGWRTGRSLVRRRIGSINPVVAPAVEIVEVRPAGW